MAGPCGARGKAQSGQDAIMYFNPHPGDFPARNSRRATRRRPIARLSSTATQRFPVEAIAILIRAFEMTPSEWMEIAAKLSARQRAVNCKSGSQVACRK